MEEQIDIHNFDKRFESKIQKIANDPKIKEINKKYINRFTEYCIVCKMKKSSITKDLYSLWFFAHNIKKDFPETRR